MENARRASRRGSILLLVVMLMAAVAVLGLALVSMIGAFHNEQTTSREELSALHVCEAGLGEAFLQLRTRGDGDLGSEANPVPYGPSSYWVEATDLGDAAGGPVTIYVARNFTLNSNAQIYSLTKTPSDVAINLSSTPAHTVKFDSNTQLWGTVYAPLADIKIDSNAQIYGSIVAWRLELNSNSRIHYDEALARLGQASDSGFTMLCWRVVQQ